MGPPEETQTEHETTTSRGSPDIEGLKTILLGLLCAVLLFLLIFLVINTWPTLVSYYRKFVPDDRNHIEKRTQTIRAWTISKPVINHERQCRHYKGRRTHETHHGDYPSDESSYGSAREICSISSESSSSLESTKVQSCGICFEPFRVNEIVSWASTSDCHHAFHPLCIEKWLLRHDDCPICRRTYMLVDYTRQKIPSRTLKVLAKERKKRRNSTYFCVRDGLVRMEVGFRGGADVLTEKQEQDKNLSIELDSSISNVDHVEMPNDLPFCHPTDNDSGSFHNVSHFTVGEAPCRDDDNQWVIFKTESTETAFTAESSVSLQV